MAQFDEFAYHELVDRVASMQEIFNCIVETHHICPAHKELKDKAEEIQGSLNDLYQLACKYSDTKNEQVNFGQTIPN